MTTAGTDQLDSTLQDIFGMSGFREGQRGVIERLLAGKSAAAVFPTGGGKSLCYQLAATQLDGLTVVVSPLLALMREQVEQLRSKGIGAERLDSSLSADEAREAMQRVRDGKSKLLYVAPERFFNERFREFISSIPISLFAIDEAHCISQWGHNFRPDYLKLARIARQLEVGCVLALTATATPTVLSDIRREFSIEPDDVLQTAFYRDNLELQFTLCDPRSRDELLLKRISESAEQPTLVYVSLQKTAEQLAELISDSGREARAYHAGLDDEVRREVQDWFMQSSSSIVVATIAFGMGIDKSNIRAIYHYNPSKSLENFAQEIGRAGRDGQPARCETLLVPEDRVVLENFAYGDTPGLQSLKTFVGLLAGQPEQFFISYYSIAHECDIRDSVIRTLLTYLELEDKLEATASRYDSYQFKPRKTSQEILANFDGERRKFAAAVLAMSVKKKIWFEVRLAAAAERLQCDRSRIVRMLDFFAEKGWIELKATGLVHGYRKKQSLGQIEVLAQQMQDYVMEREVGELTRLQELFDLAAAEQCQHATLSEHFGQPLDSACGNCGVCNQQAMGMIPEPDFGKLGTSAITGVKRLAKEHPELLGEPRQQARFLCGLTSPKISRKRLTRDALFACCSHIPFQHVFDELLAQS